MYVSLPVCLSFRAIKKDQKGTNIYSSNSFSKYVHVPAYDSWLFNIPVRSPDLGVNDPFIRQYFYFWGGTLKIMNAGYVSVVFSLLCSLFIQARSLPRSILENE